MVRRVHVVTSDFTPVTSLYMLSIAEMVGGGFFLSSSKAFEAQGRGEGSPPAPSAHDGSAKASVAGFLFPGHALVQAALGVLRVGRALLDELAPSDAAAADMDGK